MFVINYVSLNTKSGYKDFRSLSFLIDRALSFAVLLILTTPPGTALTVNHGGPLQLSTFPGQ